MTKPRCCRCGLLSDFNNMTFFQTSFVCFDCYFILLDKKAMENSDISKKGKVEHD